MTAVWESFVFGLLMASGALVGFGVGVALLAAAEATVRWWVQRPARRRARGAVRHERGYLAGPLGGGWRVDLGAVAEEITSTPLAESGADAVVGKLRRMADAIESEVLLLREDRDGLGEREEREAEFLEGSISVAWDRGIVHDPGGSVGVGGRGSSVGLRGFVQRVGRFVRGHDAERSDAMAAASGESYQKYLDGLTQAEFQRREALAERVNADLDSRVGGGRS
tara:strand:- start:923 stop:1594 length:672 start_codon:yes stop_codon:yes gene_type:complete